MEETRFSPDPKQPFSLHDCRIEAMLPVGRDLQLTVSGEFLRLKTPERPAQPVRGSILIEGIDPDFCDVIVQGKGGRRGGFRGECLSIEAFTEQYRGFSFEVISEYYGWHRLQYSGWLWMPGRAPRDMTLSLGYFTGDVVYRTEDSDE